MFGEWKSGAWRNKRAHWLAVNIYLKVVVRAVEFSVDSEWVVFVVFGGMEDKLTNAEGRPIRFPHSEVEAAKAAGLEHALHATSELLLEVQRCAA